MARSFRELPGFAKAMARKLPSAVNKVMKVAAKAAGSTAIETTRVDTGKARSNWRASLNAPTTGVIPPYAPGNKLGQGERANALAAKAQQSSVINRFNIIRDQAVFISNNVEYIGQLNDGGGPITFPGQMIEQGVLSAKVATTTVSIVKAIIPGRATIRIR